MNYLHKDEEYRPLMKLSSNKDVLTWMFNSSPVVRGLHELQQFDAFKALLCIVPPGQDVGQPCLCDVDAGAIVIGATQHHLA